MLSQPVYRPPPSTPSPNFPESRGVCTQATLSTLGTSLLYLITFPGCSHKAVFLPSGSSVGLHPGNETGTALSLLTLCTVLDLDLDLDLV